MDNSPNKQNDIDWTRGEFPTWAKMLVAVAVVLLLMLVFFRVRTFEATGNVRYTPEEIADASGLTEGDILMGINKTSTASRLLVKLPYIEQVVIEKRLPGTIVFHVQECTAAAAVESEFATVWLINAEGKLLEEIEEGNETALSAHPVVRGVLLSLPMPGDGAVFADTVRGSIAMELLDAVEDTALSASVTEINVEDMTSVYVIYEDRIQVELGDGSDGEYKLQYLKAVLPELPAGASGTLDLSFSGGEQAIFHPIA